MNTTSRAMLRRTIATRRSVRSLAVAALACTLWGCPSEDKTPAKTPESGQQARDTEIQHESCDLTSSGAAQLAVDAQGPVIISVMQGGREECRAVDLNRDGVIDVFVYFDQAGQERRRESAFGRDGLPNEVAIFNSGMLVRKERETNNDSRIDTWDFYEGGRLVREERDSTGDGYIDQWWAFNRPDQPECAIVHSDDNGDGKADEGSRIDMCADSAGAAAAAKGDKAKQPSSDDAAKSDGAASGSAPEPDDAATPAPDDAATPDADSEPDASGGE